MVVFDVVLRELAIVFLYLPIDKIGSIGFLEKDIAHIFLILEDSLDRLCCPFRLSRRAWDACLL